MSAPRHILAATDFSPAATAAAQRAAALARRSGARLTLAHVLPTDELSVWQGLLGSGDEALRSGLRHEAQQQLTAFAATLGSDPDIETQVLEGQPAAALHELAATLAADLLVLGQHGDGSAPAPLLGSTASKLLRKCRQPVLLVRRPMVDTDYAALLVAVDFSPASALSIRYARELAPGAQLTLLHAHEFPYEGKLHFAGIEPAVIERFRTEMLDQARSSLHRLAAASDPGEMAYDTALLRGAPSRVILEQAAARGSDLIVIGKHGRHLVEDLLLGSVTGHVLAAAAADVLVVVDPRRPSAER
ncbi:MAG: universal stress protein [Steroidobacteraceae bacterium]|nr:universal stress protein [Nevskiaceae bacterium]MCP5359878.1 universal stress protein [Nevskiaceae bacterium]MCP5467088.1 universal stress protein [Nevskiaceae bacterium]MCP5473172.1 universal stress protein [Nevskiaceae bacterium]